MGMQASKAVALAAAVAALAVGCGSDDDDEGGSASSETATEVSRSETSKLVRDYGRRLTDADLARTEGTREGQEAGPNQERPEPGPLALTLTDGTLKLRDQRLDVTILQDFSATSDGAFRIGAYQNPAQGSFCGPDVAQTASYTWKLSGDVLTLKAEQDPCADRDAYLGGVWKPR